MEMDHVIQVTNGVRDLQNFFCALFKLPQEYMFLRLLDLVKQKKGVCHEFKDKSIMLSIPKFCFT
jgi:hypothetical protein